jgi:hypothetical protein
VWQLPTLALGFTSVVTGKVLQAQTSNTIPSTTVIWMIRLVDIMVDLLKTTPATIIAAPACV